MRLLILLAVLFIAGHTQAEETCRGDREDCPDLLNLPVEYYEWEDVLSVIAQCGSIHVVACAKIMANDEGLTRCVIHTTRYPRKSLLRHEMNHCRGWRHQEGGKQSHAKPWRKIPL